MGYKNKFNPLLGKGIQKVDGGSLNCYDATVGVGGDYTTIQLALADEKYALKLVSDVTETVDWGNHSKDIIIDADELRTINVSISNTNNLIIRGNNINFAIYGDNHIFTSNTKLFFNYLKITRATGGNFGGLIQADNIEIYLDGGNISTYIYNCRLINIIYNQSSLIDNRSLIIHSATQIICNGDTYSTLNDLSTLFALEGVVDNLICNQTGKAYIRGGNYVINKGSGNIYLMFPSTINNCVIEYGYFSTVSNTILNNCIIKNCKYNNFYGVAHNCNFVNDVTLRSSYITHSTFQGNTVTSADCSLHYCDLNEGLSIENDNANISFNKLLNNTISVSVTADKTILTNNRTLTSIIDNGTNTSLMNNKLI